MEFFCIVSDGFGPFLIFGAPARKIGNIPLQFCSVHHSFYLFLPGPSFVISSAR